MLKRALLVMLVVPWVLNTACSHAVDDDDTTETPENPIILAISPTLDQTDFFYESDAWVQFDTEPDSVTISIEGATGSQSQDGTVFTFDIDGALESNSTYTLTVEWAPSEDSPLSFEFSTGPHGDLVTDETALVDTTFEIDLASANFVEPPGIGSIIASQLEGFHLLFMPTDESDFDADLLHTLGALGVEDGPNLVQDPCSGTLPFTYGNDGEYGTADDVPAEWDDPRFTVGPTDLALAIQGTEAHIDDVFLSGVVHPDLEDIRGMVFSGTLDTRALDGLLSDGGEEGAACDFLVDTLGISCEPCPSGAGDFCLDVLANEMSAEEVPGLVLEPLTCADVIDDFIAGGVCTEEDVADYDTAGDGTYAGCPEWVAR